MAERSRDSWSSWPALLAINSSFQASSPTANTTLKPTSSGEKGIHVLANTKPLGAVDPQVSFTSSQVLHIRIFRDGLFFLFKPCHACHRGITAHCALVKSAPLDFTACLKKDKLYFCNFQSQKNLYFRLSIYLTESKRT